MQSRQRDRKGRQPKKKGLTSVSQSKRQSHIQGVRHMLSQRYEGGKYLLARRSHCAWCI